MFRKSHLLLLLSILGMILIIGGSTVLGLTWPEYNIFKHTVSVLASIVAPTKAVMNTIFVLDGILLMMFGTLLNKILVMGKKKVGTGHFLAFSGVLLVLLPFFPGGKVMGVTASTQLAHNIIAGTLILSFVVAPFFLIKRLKDSIEWKTTLIAIMVITALKFLSYTISLLAMFLVDQISLYPGIFQKVGLALDGSWMILLSLQLIRLKLPTIGNEI